MKSDPIHLSALQMAVMQRLWQEGEATVAKVHGDLVDRHGWAFTTISTTLTRLEKRGLVARRALGRKYVYRAQISQKEAVQANVEDLISRVFGGDSTVLVNHLLTESEINRGDLEKIKALIEDLETASGD